MDETRWAHLTRARRAFEERSETAAAGPLEAFLEVSARCNLRCVMCAINVDQRYRAGAGRPALLEPAVFDRLRTTFPTLIRGYLFGLGEPLLNPRLAEYAAQLGSVGAEVWFNTNGTLIDDDAADALARAGVTAVTVSMDGATPETYERIRRGASFAAALRGVRALVSARRRFGRPAVDLSFVAMAGNLAELPALLRLCAAEGVGSVHVEPLFGQQRDELGQLYHEQNLGVLGAGRVAEIFAEAERTGRELGVRIGSRFLAEEGDPDYLRRSAARPVTWRCSEPWTSAWVTTAGEVRCCCLNDTSFGNLADATLAEVWNGPGFRAFRRAHGSGSTPPSCANCVRNGRVRLSPWFAPVEPVTYRPLRVDSSAEPASGGPTLDWPPADGLVTDPLVVTGRTPCDARPRDLEVVIDRTVVALLQSAVVEGRRFAVSIPVPYLTEGAHLLWLRPRGRADHPGWEHRQIHCWRPEVRGSIRSAGLAVVPVEVSRWRGGPRVEVDGVDSGFEWLRGGRMRGHRGAVVLDTTGLVPGGHAVTLRPPGRPAQTIALERLPDLESG